MAAILIVEDNANNLELMRYLLHAAGHDITCAESGADGVEAAVHAPPDLVVLDIHLPDTSGFQVLDALRKLERVGGCPVVAVTANAMVGDRDNALAAGFDGYISKPIDPRQFASTINAMLPAALRAPNPTIG
jgi:CheY-like chemotaxis protein